MRGKHLVTSDIFKPFRFGSPLRPFLIAATLAFFAASAPAQEALRQSMAGEAAEEASRQAASSVGYYNLMLGPVAWRFSSGLEADYNDNVNLRPNNPDGDFIFRPSVNAQMVWPVTQNNSLNFELGAGYSFYVQHQELDQLYINPGSQLSFDIYIKDLKINLHDRLSVTENGYENPGLTNGASIVRLENTAGVSGLWDLNEAEVDFGYDHVNYLSLVGNQVPDGSSENLFASAGFRVRPEFLAGFEVGGGLFNSDPSASTPFPNASQWNVGLFCRAQISEYLNAEFHAGYTVYSPQATAVFTNASPVTGLYFELSLTHRLNQFVTYTLAAGRSTDYSNYGVPDEYYFVRFEPDWNIFRKFTLTTPVTWEHGTQLNGVSNSNLTFDQINAEISLGCNLTQKLSATLSEQIVHESANQINSVYTVNIVSLNFSYQF